MSDVNTRVIVWVLAPSGGGVIASWIGNPPTAGDGIQVDKCGEHCTEPGRYTGVVQSRRWADRLMYAEHNKLPRHTTECFVSVAWDAESERAWEDTFKGLGS